MIRDFDVSCFKPVSYALRLKTVSTFSNTKDIPDLKEQKLPYLAKPGEYVLGTSVEVLEFPQNLLGLVVPTSFAIRIGIGINAGKIDPTYKGEVNFGICNSTNRKIKLEKNMQLVHLLISEFKGETIPLETKFFGGKM